jgi:hypothetical protein
MKKVISGLIVAAATGSLIAPAALANGNSGAAYACQQNGWQDLVRQDGTGFKNTGDCGSYAAQGGVLKAKPTGGSSTSTGGSENFSEDLLGSTPATFSGGTIDPAAYAPSPAWDPSFPAGGILATGPYFNVWPSGTHFLFTGIGQNTAKLTFTNSVKSVQLQAQSDKTDIATTLTLTGYDATGKVVNTATGVDAGYDRVDLAIASSSANIKYFTIATDDPNVAGLGFTNISWS